MNLKRLLDAARSTTRPPAPPPQHTPQIELTADTAYRIDRITGLDGSYAASVATAGVVVVGNAQELRRAAAELESAALCIDFAEHLDADCMTPLDSLGGEPA
ncbi:hypothetical protein [Streptomyces ipomoeae]|uniref:hypothetical protein n=1 Tax=Streptomyces ipomoeae TaxID=103232 RepID=UPI0011467870|nr:hypothetical protein [Streptomyces ipomoeae]TQE33133.1 hypothetical protein Sipo7851_21805 [Streptomyces ipomoeae]